MTYREFVDKIVEKAKNMTGIDNVFFREADDRLAEDSIMVVLCGDDKDKFVGRILPGEAYRDYQSGRSMNQILKEIKARIRFLMDVGLDYLTLARSTGLG